jgi:hypothetical protein
MPRAKPQDSPPRVLPTRGGFRLVQNGTVLSELRVRPGPTHSIFDVLAASIALLLYGDRFALLGFAAGSLMGPLRALGVQVPVHAVDLDGLGHQYFQRYCSSWAGELHWSQAEAARWLRGQRGKFNLILDDLSIPLDGDVAKPAISWEVLPKLMRQRLRKDGVVISNLLRPTDGTWREGWRMIRDELGDACLVIEFQEFENRLLIAGAQGHTARSLTNELNKLLWKIGSKQTGRFKTRSLSSML